MTTFGTFFEFIFLCFAHFLKNKEFVAKWGEFVTHKRFTAAAADLPQPNVSFHIDKTNNFFFQKN